MTGLPWSAWGRQFYTVFWEEKEVNPEGEAAKERLNLLFGGTASGDMEL